MPDDAESFDIENPDLPKAIKKAALGSGGYPYERRLGDEDYANQLIVLQGQLIQLQTHLQKTGGRMMLVFEGRDAAGKGGAIKTYLEHVNPRYNVDVALPKPSDREKTQWYFQRYVDWLPAAGETVLFDRSWYNRAGVEPVMGYCTQEETERFLEEAPRFEKMLTRDGIFVFKFWLSIGREMQLKRFHDRRHDPLKIWKISPIDYAALAKWEEYTLAAEKMLAVCSPPEAPWHVVLANDKRRARLEIVRSVLAAIDYEGKDKTVVGAVDGKIVMDPARYLRDHHRGQGET